MKNVLFIIILFFIKTFSASAQECNWKESKKDPISDTKYLKSKKVVLVGDQKWGSVSDKKFLDATIALQDGTVFFQGLFQRYRIMSVEKIEKPSLIIKLANGVKIESNSEENFSTKLSPNYTESNLRWKISKDDVTKLSESPITALKFSSGGEDFLFELTEKKGVSLLEMFKCMIKEL